MEVETEQGHDDMAPIRVGGATAEWRRVTEPGTASRLIETGLDACRRQGAPLREFASEPGSREAPPIGRAAGGVDDPVAFLVEARLSDESSHGQALPTPRFSIGYLQ